MTPGAAEASPEPSRRQRAQPRPGYLRDEHYALDLCDELLGEQALRQHRFAWLACDPDAGGRRRLLPVDGFYPRNQLVVEYREHQHDRPTRFFDKPDRLTVSGVHRGEQRRLYDRRREVLIPQYGLRLWVVVPSDVGGDRRGRLSDRDPQRDLSSLRAAWSRGLSEERHRPTR